ncbi:MAG: hypothetical protein ACSHXB_15015 [Sulfitobacter sp.]
MNNIAAWVGAISTIAFVGGYPQETKAEAFTGEAFLQWPEADQKGYISAQVGMAASIAARIKPDVAQCISDTFYRDDGIGELVFETAVERIAEFKSYHPSSVLVVVIENACGPFN